MKKFIFVCVLLLTMSTVVFATDVKVKINDSNVDFTDASGNVVNAQIVNSRTMVPMRKIFELLGLSVEWDGENKIVTGKKDNLLIQLQIDNNIATKELNGTKTQIELDTPPMIIENRTMVPLRFIAESLDKQVGWDKDARTAVIIDYSYFLNTLKTKAKPVYNFLINDLVKDAKSEYTYYDDKYTHKYFDLKDANQNTEFAVNTKLSVKDDYQKVTLNISGTSELGKEIFSEGWNSSMFELNYGKDKVKLSADNVKLIEMFKLKKNQKIYSYEELELEGDADISLENSFRLWANVSENELNVNTFSKLKDDFELLCGFLANPVTTANDTTYNFSLRYSNYKLKYFDFARLDNFIFDNEHIKIYNLINKLFFKTDINANEMIYDNSNIKVKLTIKNNADEANLVIETENNFSEKNEYILNMKKIISK